MLSLLTTVLSVLPASVTPAPATPIPVAIARATTPASSDEPTFDERLQLLVERLEQERVANHVAGFGFAVVKDDEIVLARGFGLADVESGRPVEADTIFAIGSSTKAFTATLIGMQQDDEILTFDDPVTDYLPYFELPIEGPDAKGNSTVTLRDLLSHRTGFTRMSHLWMSPGVPIETILKTAVGAEPWAGFREQFLYNNIMFLAAGTASAAAVDGDWGDLIQTRIFAPLGMGSSSVSVVEAQKDERLALGYTWNVDAERFERKRMVLLDSIGPAGSINSNVIDMAQWLRFQLGRGEYEGRRLITEEALLETWEPTTQMSTQSSYGLGWMLHELMDQRVIEHGGNIDGFSANVGFMPDAGIGFVLLANQNMSPLQQGAVGIVFDALVGEIEEPTDVPEGAYGEYIGKYRANFGPFDDVDFEVLVQNGNLSVDIPDKMIVELRAPNDEGKWQFRRGGNTAVSFERDDEGRIVGLNLYEDGMTFEMPRDGVVIAPEVPLEELDEFLGFYRNAAVGADAEVIVQNGRVAVDVPGQMAFELHAPDEDGWRNFRVSDQISVRFNRDESGRVSSFTINERGTKREMKRVTDDDPEAVLLPTVDDLLELRGQSGSAALLETHGTIRVTGTMRIAQSGLDGTFTLEARQEPQAYRMTMDFGAFGRSAFGSDGENVWTNNSLQGYNEPSGDRRRQIVRGHPSFLEGDWSETFDSLSIQRVETKDDREIIVVKARAAGLPARRMYVDVDTGFLVRSDYVHVEGPMRFPFRATYDDFREVEGVMVPHRSVERNDMTGRAIQTVEAIEVGVELATDFYAYDETKE